MGTIKNRAVLVFGQASERVTTECKVMHADHAAKGLLKSGATVKRAVQIFCDCSTDALRQILNEVAQNIEHRGRAWTAAMDQVKEALDEHTTAASVILEPSFRLANLTGGAEQAAKTLIVKCSEDLQAELTAYRDGWTAPKPRSWTERHPAIYAIILLVIGSIIGTAFSHFLPSGSS